MKRNCTLHEMRQLFLEYFKERDHSIILPYPIVARWRDEVDLVGASMMDLRAYGVEGVGALPAIPFVVSAADVLCIAVDSGDGTAGLVVTMAGTGRHEP